MKQQEHLKQVERMIQEQRAKRNEEILMERMSYEQQVKMQEYEKQVIEEERQKLLSQHASKLVGFMPKVSIIFNKGVWRDQQELEQYQ